MVRKICIDIIHTFAIHGADIQSRNYNGGYPDLGSLRCRLVRNEPSLKRIGKLGAKQRGFGPVGYPIAACGKIAAGLGKIVFDILQE